MVPFFDCSVFSPLQAVKIWEKPNPVSAFDLGAQVLSAASPATAAAVFALSSLYPVARSLSLSLSLSLSSVFLCVCVCVCCLCVVSVSVCVLCCVCVLSLSLSPSVAPAYLLLPPRSPGPGASQLHGRAGSRSPHVQRRRYAFAKKREGKTISVRCLLFSFISSVFSFFFCVRFMFSVYSS